MSQEVSGFTSPETTIKHYWDVLRRRRLTWLFIFVVILAAGIAATLLSSPLYVAEARLKVPTAAIALNIYDSSNPIANILAASQPDAVETQIQVLQSTDFLDKAYERAGIQPQAGVRYPTPSFNVIEGTNILVVAVEGGDPDEVARLANAIVDLHRELTELEALAGIDKAIDFVSTQLTGAARDKDRAQSLLMAFSRSYDGGPNALDEASLIREIVEARSRLGTAEANIRAVQAEIRDLEIRLKIEPLEIMERHGRDNPELELLKTRLLEHHLQRDDLLATLKEDNDRIRVLDRQITRLEARMKSIPEESLTRVRVPNPRLATLRQRLADQYALLRGHREERSSAAAALKALPQPRGDRAVLDFQRAVLQASLQKMQGNYNDLDQRLRDLRLRRAAMFDSSVVIQRALVPREPIQPRRLANLLLTLVLALAFATIITIALELLDDRIHTLNDVERVSAMPCLSFIPTFDTRGPRLLQEVGSGSGQSHILESFRRLRTSIGFAAIDAPVRRLLVTSASKGEGKSLISMNLANIMAMDGKRVLLMDGDLRRPSIHQQVGLPNHRGLSQLLTGQISLDDAVQETDIPNLRVICAGALPPNPPELLGSHAFEELLTRLETVADVIIVDSPPCIPVTDPLIVASRMDGVVLVVHVGQSRRAHLRQAEEMLSRSRGRILGVVMNRVRSRRGDYYYDYGYYSSYHEDSEPGKRRRTA